MEQRSTPNIFLSYSWANKVIADIVDGDFKAMNLILKRDVRDAPYGSNFVSFMKEVKTADHVLVIISKEYLTSVNAMTEIMDLLDTGQLEKRILPIIIENALEVSNPYKRETYYNYWNKEADKARELRRNSPNIDFVNYSKKCNRISEHLDEFFSKIIDINIGPFEVLRNEGYQSLLNIIGFNPSSGYEEAEEIMKMQDVEERELALEAFLRKHPNNQYGLFYKAYQAFESKEYKKANNYYSQVLYLYPDYVPAHYNLGLLLELHFSDHEGARKRYLEALRLDPGYSFAAVRLAGLLVDRFKDLDGALSYYKQALAVDPENDKVHFSMGKLLEVHFSQYQAAAEQYLEALRLNPKHVDARFFLAKLYFNQLRDKAKAKWHYQKLLEVDDKVAGAYNNLGLIHQQEANFEAASRCYKKALELDAGLNSARINLASLPAKWR